MTKTLKINNKIKTISEILKAFLLKLLLSNRITENFYYSLRISIKNNFKKIVLFRDDKFIGENKISKTIIYDKDIRHIFVFFMPSLSKFLLSEIFYNRQYLLYRDEIKDIVNKKIKKNSIFYILDLGANIGIFSIYYYYLLKDLKSKPSIYLFEPLPYNLKFLEKNLARNEIKDYSIFPNAVCEKSGDSVDLFIGGSYTGPSIIETEKYVTEQATDKIRVKTLEIDDLKIKNVGLIKLDIEGAEELALKGMEKTITANAPIIICSYEHQTNNKDFIIKYVSSCGDYKHKDDRSNKLLYFLPRN